MSVLCVIQARVGSSRLPGKVLEKVGGISLIERVVRRASRAQSVDDVVIATTSSEADGALVAAGEAMGVRVHRGSEYDVLDRYHMAIAEHPDAQVIVRLTADCPFIDPAVIDRVVDAQRRSGADFVANRLPPPYRRTYPVGLDVEVATREALETAWREAREPHHREHVMPYLYESDFTVRIVDLDEDLSAIRWTVDTPDDLRAVRLLVDLTPGDPDDWREFLATANMHPEIGAINASAAQKNVRATDARWDCVGSDAPSSQD